MFLRKKLDEESIKSKFEKSSNTLDEILSIQRPSSNRSGLEFDKKRNQDIPLAQTKMEIKEVVLLFYGKRSNPKFISLPWLEMQ